ncbi:MAG: hypothetical protein ACI8Y4_003576 [Candidatus Poriferisodalaceae bacterium]|jgi:hypothetical protein
MFQKAMALARVAIVDNVSVMANEQEPSLADEVIGLTYGAIGFGVLKFQRAMVARRDAEKKCRKLVDSSVEVAMQQLFGQR